MGKSPQLVTAEGRVITESSTIAKYLIDTYDTGKKFQGDGAKNDFLRDDELTSFSATNLNMHITMDLLFKAMAERAPFFIRPLVNLIHGGLKKAFLDAEFRAEFKYLDDQLGDQDYFMGTSPGRADFMISWPIDLVTQQNSFDLSPYSKLTAWHQRCHAREAWKRSIEKGNGYTLKY